MRTPTKVTIWVAMPIKLLAAEVVCATAVPHGAVSHGQRWFTAVEMPPLDDGPAVRRRDLPASAVPHHRAHKAMCTSALPGRPRAVEGRSMVTNVDRCRQLSSRPGR